MYDYNARVVRWKDGDTVVLHVDQGFGNWTEQPFRIVGLAAPEKNTPEGVMALNYASNTWPAGSVVSIDSRKPTAADIWHWAQLGRTFERWLAVMYVQTPEGDKDFAKLMIEKGFGTRYGS